MAGRYNLSSAILAGAALCAGVGGISDACAGAFGIQEQSTIFMGSAFAGAAAGGDISSMYWNPAATAALPGINDSENFTGIFGHASVHADGGLFVTGNPQAFAPGLAPSSQIGTDALVPASYTTYQYSDQLYFGLALNSPFGLITTPGNTGWAGSPIATTTKVLSFDANPTVAYKISPEWTIGAGLQIEYFEIRLDRGAFGSTVLGPLSASRTYEADDTSVGATAGILWQPQPGTSVGLGYRSAVTMDLSGRFTNGAFTALPPAVPVPTSVPAFAAVANASVTLPDEVTLSARQAVTDRLAVLGTVEWNNWSHIGNVSAISGGCVAVTGSGTCETLNLNYRDGWLFSAGAEYLYTPLLTLRGGVAYEISPIQNSTRDILVPDANRVFLNVGASYKVSDVLSVNVAYSHIFFDNAPFCEASPQTGSTHCSALTPQSSILLTGSADVSGDIVSVGINYRISGPAPLEPLK